MWKDEYLVFCLYVRSDVTQKFCASIFGIGVGNVSDIFYSWAHILDSAFCEIFPRPSSSQMIQAYPSHFIGADGHVCCFLLLHAFEIFAQQSLNLNVASSTYSNYNGHCTVKVLGGIDNIGCSHAKTISAGSQCRHADGSMTAESKMLREIPFGFTIKMDKGFIVDNEAVHKGVIVDRPTKRLCHQIQ